MAQANTGGKQYGMPVKVAVVLLIFVQMTQALCNPSLAGIMADFPDAPVTSVQTIINIATLIMIPAALVTGPIANKIGYKTTGIIAMIIALIGGVAPAFIHPSVEFMIFERGIFGIGYGMVYTLSIAACGEFWRGKGTSALIGAVNFGAGLAGILYNLFAAALAPMGWEAIYYSYFIIVPILIYYAIVMPQHSELPKGETADKPAEKASFAALGTKFWLYIVGMAIALMSVCVFMNNIAMIVVGTGIDATGAAVAGIMTGFTVGMMIGGAAYPVLYRYLKRAALPIYLFVDAICFAAIIMAPDLMVLTVCAVVIGIVFSGLNCAWGDMANKKVAVYPAVSALGTSVFIAAAGIAQFFSPFVMSGLAGIAGQTEANPFYQYYPAIAIIVVGGIFLLVMAIVNKNKIDYEREDATAEPVSDAAELVDSMDA